MMLLEDFKRSINSLKEIQENTVKQVEALKEEAQKSVRELQENTGKQVEETQKFLKELQENTSKQVMDLNKTIQDLKLEIETIRKTQQEITLEIETLGKKTGTIDASISNRIQEMEERISGAEDGYNKENAKCKKIQTQNLQEIRDTMIRQNLWIIGIDENEDFQLKVPVNIFNKIIEENFPNLKKEMPMNIQEDYRTPNRLDQKRNTSQQITIRTTNALNKDRILKAGKSSSNI
jgi:chromosome segregation ATPase